MPKFTLSEMGALIRERRGAQGVRTAAAEVGVSPATLSRVENGKQPDLETFEKLCQWLGISPADVLRTNLPEATQSTERLATAHLKASRQISPALAEALGEMILRAQAMAADDSRPDLG